VLADAVVVEQTMAVAELNPFGDEVHRDTVNFKLRTSNFEVAPVDSSQFEL
jgi:hypothetical protein